MLFECKNLNLIYDEGKEMPTYALKNINLDFEGNKLIGIMGPSGSGKSSLMYCLAGLKVPTSGSVKYRNVVLSEVHDSEKANIRRTQFGFIFQRHFLIDYMDVLHNVLTVINDFSADAREKAISFMTKLKIEHLAYKMPYQLSGGQRQRVAIARAFMNDPKVVFADEITSALDHDSAHEVMEVLNEYKKNAVIFIVTHDPSILKNADEVIHIWDGSIKETTSELKR